MKIKHSMIYTIEYELGRQLSQQTVHCPGNYNREMNV